MATTIKWIDNNVIETAHRIYKSSTYFTKDNLPAPLVELGPDITEYVDSAGVDGENWYIVSALLNDYEVFSEPFIGGLQLPSEVGPTAFIGGDLTAGFYGEVPTTDLISGDALASEIGLTAGVSQFSTEPWLKFAIDGKTIFVAKKTYRHSISWDAIYQAGAVYGTDDNGLYPTGTPTNQNTIITIDGYNYKVRLLTGGDGDPSTGAGGEYNKLLYQIITNSPINNTWANYSDTEIHTIYSAGDGAYTWCQETDSTQVSSRVYRGEFTDGENDYWTSSSTMTAGSRGWRPVLELIQ